MASPQTPGPSVGVDAGASLAKLVYRADAAVCYELHPAGAVRALHRRIAALAPARVALTGAGARELARRLGPQASCVSEFAAWGCGSRALSREQGLPAVDPFLVVSLGTGTSVMLSSGSNVSRVGGTALGGGTVVGLGALLLGESEFSRVAELAAAGDRRQVDLLVSDIYPPGEISLPGEITAASFGSRRLLDGANPPRPEDLAHGIMGLVGENVALLCAGLAAASRARRILFGGSTLRGNPVLREILALASRGSGCEVVFLEHGEFAGALGALLLGTGS